MSDERCCSVSGTNLCECYQIARHKRIEGNNKRFLLFKCEMFYPQGPKDDLSKSFSDLNEAILEAKKYESEDNFQWAEIFDCEERKFIDFGSRFRE